MNHGTSEGSAFRGVVLAVVLALAVACSKDAPSRFHGVSLGMRPADVRARFDLPAGHWQNDGGLVSSGRKGDAPSLTLSWKRDAEGGEGVRAVTFEFHNGLLVAVRADVMGASDAWTQGASRRETPSTVYARDVEGPTNLVRWIARDCPEHDAEVRAILSSPK